MNIESLRRHAAEKVMGWQWLPPAATIGPAYSYPDGGGMRVDHWRPDEDANQALMLLESMSAWARLSHGSIVVWDNEDSDYEAFQNSGKFALNALIAVCRATGWQE